MDSTINTKDYLDYKYKDTVTDVTPIGDDIYIINGKYRAIYIDNSYFLIEYDPVTKINYIYNSKGDRIPVKINETGQWDIDKGMSNSCSFMAKQRSAKNPSACNVAELDRGLEDMGFDPGIRHLSELKEVVEHRYGPDMMDFLLERNPSFNMDYPIDGKMLSWLTDAITESKIDRYVFTPFSKNADVLIYDLFGKFNKNKPGATPIFLNKNQFSKFKDQLDSEKDLIIEIVAKQNHLTSEEANGLFDVFYAHYTSDPQFRLDSIPHKRPVIHLVGHGDAGDDILYPGDNGHYFYAFEVVDKLIKSGVSDASIIKLDFCWSACKSKPTDYISDEALAMLKKGDFEELFGDIDGSFMGEFHQEIKNKLPKFSGHITGYYGTVMTSIQNDVLSIKGSSGRYYAVEVHFSDKKIFIKKEDMSVTLKA